MIEEEAVAIEAVVVEIEKENSLMIEKINMKVIENQIQEKIKDREVLVLIPIEQKNNNNNINYNIIKNK